MSYHHDNDPQTRIEDAICSANQALAIDSTSRESLRRLLVLPRLLAELGHPVAEDAKLDLIRAMHNTAQQEYDKARICREAMLMMKRLDPERDPMEGVPAGWESAMRNSFRLAADASAISRALRGVEEYPYWCRADRKVCEPELANGGEA